MGQFQARRLWAHGTALALVIGATPGWAQESGGADAARGGLVDIIVTAQRREQLLQDVPVAVTALTEATLVANRVLNIRDLDTIAPGLLVKPVVGGAALPSYTLRGLVTVGNVTGSDKGVGVYVDGVYIGAALGGISNFADLERVEVLRGPQGTLFGRNSTGGAISFTTREPNGQFGVKQTLTYGNYDQFRSVTSLSTPQFGPISAYVTYAHTQRDGDIHNLGAGQVWDVTRAFNGTPTTLTSPRRMGDFNGESVFAAVKGEFGDFKAIYRFDWSDEEYSAPGYGTAYLSPPFRAFAAAQPDQSILTPVSRKRPDAVNNRNVTPSRNKGWGQSLTLTMPVNDSISLKNIAAYRKSSVSSGLQDVSGFGGLVVPADLAARTFLAGNLGLLTPSFQPNPAALDSVIGQPLIWNLPSTVSTLRQWSNEFQVNISTPWFNNTTGLLYYKQDTDYGYVGSEGATGTLRNGSFIIAPGYQLSSPFQVGNGGGRFSKVKLVSKALFSQTELHLTDQIDIIGGLRFTQDRKTGPDNTGRSNATPNTRLAIDYEDDQVTFNVGINYKPTSDMLLYGKYATGYISGGQLSTVSYAPETAKSWEAGIKADWLDRTLRTNLALFTVKYAGLQQVTTPRSSPVFSRLAALGITQVLFNAGTARAKGAELETMFTPTRSVMLSANLSYLDFKYLSLAPALSAGASEVPPQHRPKWTAQLAAQYTSDPVMGDAFISARIDANWKSKQFLGTAVSAGQFANTGIWNLAAPAGSPVYSTVFTPAETAALKDALSADPYWLVNARLALEDIRLGGLTGSLALWGKNIFDNKSPTFAVNLVSLTSLLYEPARTYGVDLTVKF